MKPSIGNQFSQLGLGNFVDINIFLRNIIFMVSFMFSLYFLLLDVNLHNCIYPKKETRKFRSTILVKFRALASRLTFTVHQQIIDVKTGTAAHLFLVKLM